MGDLIMPRFNWKWNRKNAPPFLTNSWQQDYPQLGNKDMGWLEEFDLIEINSTSVPVPMWGSPDTMVYRQLSRTRLSAWRPMGLCWMYNRTMSYGVWPGAGVVYYPRISTGPTQANPIMSMIDANGNLLIVTGFGTTGATAPVLPASTAEGETVTDGGVTWTVVDPDSVGFRLNCLPSQTQPVYQVCPYYQARAVRFTQIDGTMIDPIPDDQSRHFRRGYECYCLKSSPNPGDRARFIDAHQYWLQDMDQLRTEAAKETEAYGLIPATYPYADTWGTGRNPQDPSQPY
jgi:hypothetical protein